MRVSKNAIAAVISILSIVYPRASSAGGEWPDGPHKEWFQNLKRPDIEREEYWDAKSRSCCGAADVVKTKFMVEPAHDKYPEDRWYAWLNNKWALIPPEKIVKEHAPDGQAYLFVTVGGYIMCFVRPKGGL
jgi:hypothetical protein